MKTFNFSHSMIKLFTVVLLMTTVIYANAQNTYRWNGNGTSWHNGNNWTNISVTPNTMGVVPGVNDNVELGTHNGNPHNNQPSIGSDAEVNNVFFGDKDSEIKISGGALLTINGNLTNSNSNNFTHKIDVGNNGLLVKGEVHIGGTGNQSNNRKLTIEIGSSGTATFEGNINLNGSGRIMLNGTGKAYLSGNLNNLGIIEANSGTFTFNGTTNQTISGNATAFNDFVVDKSNGDLTLNIPVTVNGNLNLINGIVNTTSTNRITLSSSGIISGGNDHSFINGPLAHTYINTVMNSTSNRIFPIGKGGEYLPAELNIQLLSGNATIVSLEQINSAPVSKNIPGGLFSVSTVRHFAITRHSGDSIVNAEVKISYNGADGVEEPADLRLAFARTAASTWGDIGGVGTSAGNGTITSSAATSLNTGFFVLASSLGTNPLPVELINFNAEYTGKNVQLNWATASEQNNSHFEIERSTNGSEWLPVSHVGGNGNSNTRINYTFVDENPANGINYYRLKQVDFDGTFDYSNIAVVKTQTPVVVTISENPVVSSNFKIYVDGAATEGNDVNIIIYNMNGQVMNAQVISGSSAEINVDNLKSGNYILKVVSENTATTHRLVVIR